MGSGDGSALHNLHQSLHQEVLHHQRPHPHQMTLLKAHKCKQIHKLRRQNCFHYTNANPPHEKVVRGKKKKPSMLSDVYTFHARGGRYLHFKTIAGPFDYNNNTVWRQECQYDLLRLFVPSDQLQTVTVLLHILLLCHYI